MGSVRTGAPSASGQLSIGFRGLCVQRASCSPPPYHRQCMGEACLPFSLLTLCAKFLQLCFLLDLGEGLSDFGHTTISTSGSSPGGRGRLGTNLNLQGSSSRFCYSCFFAHSAFFLFALAFGARAVAHTHCL